MSTKHEAMSRKMPSFLKEFQSLGVVLLQLKVYIQTHPQAQSCMWDEHQLHEELWQIESIDKRCVMEIHSSSIEILNDSTLETKGPICAPADMFVAGLYLAFAPTDLLPLQAFQPPQASRPADSQFAVREPPVVHRHSEALQQD